ncbi:uncharacterized protein LOC135171326 [Diachasmimorpha longicaudata]|uniref:uncharacterized protein LOC135171326 n=1 Tax=Diachasmimorpha longicaudata TaxID=58733 RepID=UPI0030B904E4
MKFTSKEEQYRLEQEAFVSNHGGSSPMDIFLVMLPHILAINLTHSIFINYSKKFSKNSQTVIEFLVNVVPGVLCCTILSDYIMTVITIMIISVLILSSITYHNPQDIRDVKTTKISFVTHFRALTNIITAICILGVDFRIFPRKYAKTEDYGYSLMDTGVGLFIIANALVAPEARNSSRLPRGSFLRRLNGNVRRCIREVTPLLILGISRFIAVEFIGYQKHVSEYGVHWNFFITLAFVRIFTSTISIATTPKFVGLAGFWIIVMHEYALNTNGLKHWVLGDALRTDFVSANREGLISIPGYVGLYLIGIALGKIIHEAFGGDKKRCHLTKFKMSGIQLVSNKFQLTLITKMMIIAGLCWIITAYCGSTWGVSRRLANAGYCFWIVTLSTALLGGLMMADVQMNINVQIMRSLRKSRRNDNQRIRSGDGEGDGEFVRITPEIFDAVNYNGLGFFLGANLMTGGINMIMWTLYVDIPEAVQVIIGYMGVLIMISVVLYRRKIQLKVCCR